MTTTTAIEQPVTTYDFKVPGINLTDEQYIHLCQMAEPLTTMQRNFCFHYIESHNAGKAMKAAGSKAKTDGALRVGGFEVLTNPNAKAFITAVQGLINSSKVCSLQERAETLSEIIRARHSDFLTMGADGVWMHDIGPETLNQAALRKVKTRITTEGGNKGEVLIEKQFDEIELEPKIPAIKELGAVLGDVQQQQDSGGRTGTINIILAIPDPKPVPIDVEYKE